MTMRYWKTMIVVFLSAGALAVADASTQRRASTTQYQLVTVNGRPLPALVDDRGYCAEELLSATLALADDGRWALVSTDRDVCRYETDEDVDSEQGEYTLQGRTVSFEPNDGDGSSTHDEIEIDEMDAGTLVGDELVVRLRDGRTELVFRR